jgi:hypothetical protein
MKWRQKSRPLYKYALMKTLTAFVGPLPRQTFRFRFLDLFPRSLDVFRLHRTHAPSLDLSPPLRWPRLRSLDACLTLQRPTLGFLVEFPPLRMPRSLARLLLH